MPLDCEEGGMIKGKGGEKGKGHYNFKAVCPRGKPGKLWDVGIST
jgi:hypothetical protein